MAVAGVVVLGAIMSILDITVVAVAQRTFQDIFGKTQAQVAWTSTGYTLALATVIPLTGWAAESPLGSGWLVAPQGFGAMITMPIAGFLADRIGPGKVVLTGLVLDTLGLGLLMGVDDKTSYARIITAFVIMGLGLGSTTMPVFTAALSSLKDQDVARGSTLMNITQQIAISIGTALFSVLLTNAYNGQAQVVGPTLALQNGADPAALGLSSHRAQAVIAQGLHFMGESFGNVFMVATVLVGLCLVPAFFLPRKPAVEPVDATAVMVD